MDKKGTVYFFTGLAGAGKTTIGGLFYERLKRRSPEAVLLDGDQVRLKLGDSTADGTVLVTDRYTTQARKTGALQTFRRIREVRAWNRENIANYREIYIKVTRETLYRRDQKKLYSSGAKNVVGVDLPYDEPGHSNIVIQNDGQETPEEIVSRLEKFFGLE